jgi:hypothetical protein
MSRPTTIPSEFTVENITSLRCVKKNKKLVWTCTTGRETQAAYRLRMNTLVKAEIPAHLESGQPWKDFDPSANNLLFPSTYAGFCLHYAGLGRMLTYNMQTLRSTLFANKKANNLKQCSALIDTLNFVNDCEIEEVGHVVVSYSNGMNLDIDPAGRYAEWTQGERTVCGYDMSEHETASQLLAAIETYAEGGELDQNYALFLVKALGVSLKDLNNNQKGRFLDDELGL